MVHLPIVLSALGVSHVIRYINARYLLTYFTLVLVQITQSR